MDLETASAQIDALIERRWGERAKVNELAEMWRASERAHREKLRRKRRAEWYAHELHMSELVFEQHEGGTHEILLRLRLVGAWGKRGEDLCDALHHGPRLLLQGLPVWAAWQRRIQVVVGEQPVVAVRPYLRPWL